jgi:putative heme-binding domain-containing protein
MDGGELRSDAIVPLLESTDAILKDTAWWIAGHRPEWGGAFAGFFQKQLAGGGLTGAARRDLEQKLARFGDNAAVQELLASTAARGPSPDARLTALGAMAGSKARMKVLPASWMAPLVAALLDGDVEVGTLAVAVVRATPAAKESAAELQAALLRVARDSARPIALRVDALASMPEGFTIVDRDLFDLLRASLEPGQPTLTRASAAGVLEKIRLDREQLLALSGSLKLAGPLELPRLLRAFEHGTDDTVGQALILALEQSKTRSALRPDAVRAVLAKYSAAVQKHGEALLGSILVDAAQQSQRLEQLLGSLTPGDVRRGQAVFNSQKAACLSCHAIGYVGGRVGPDLTRIGQVRSERDLLEAIVYPSASFARSYEPFAVRTRSGALHTGVLRSDLSDEVVLATATGDEIRIPRPDIADLQPGTVSLMPPGLDQQLTRQELADLLAFLKATRSGA